MKKVRLFQRNVKIPEPQYTEYKKLKKEFGTTLTRIFLKGLEQEKKAYIAREKYARENNSTLAFLMNKVNNRIDTIEPRQGWYQIIFIKNIERISLNTVNVHYLNYQFLDSRKNMSVKKISIDRLSIDLINRFIR